MFASAKVEHFLSKEHPVYEAGEEVDALVWQRTDLGYKVIVDNKFGGMLYHNEVFQPLSPGKRVQAYVKQVRETGRLIWLCKKQDLGKWMILLKLCFNTLKIKADYNDA